MAEKKSTVTARYRNFACVVYPDSAPDRWVEILGEQLVPSFISPYHSLDKNPTGEDKKPHYHIMMMFEGKKSLDQVREIFSQFGGVGCEVVGSLRGYARYLCHLDNPEKQQYSVDQVQSFAGADYVNVIGLPTDRFKAIAEMEAFCDKYDVTSFYLLSKYASSFRSDWHRVLCESASVYMREYLKSRKWSVETGCIHIVDHETGDVII